MSPSLLDFTINELIRRHPETLPIFAANGLEIFTDEENRSTIGAAIRLNTALKAAGINVDLFLRLLEEAMNPEIPPANGKHPEETPRCLNLFALLPCPLKIPMEEAFNGFLASLPAKERNRLTFRLEGNANNQIDTKLS